MARPRQFEESAALDSAMTAFWRRGYAATSVQDLVDETGLNRGSLYGSFGDKHTLFLGILDHYSETVAARWIAILAEGPSGLGAIRHFFSVLVECSAADPRHLGCLITNTAVELGPHDAELSARVGRAYAALEAGFVDALDRARASGEIGADRDLQALAWFLVCATQGMLVLSKVTPGRLALGKIAEVVHSTIGS